MDTSRPAKPMQVLIDRCHSDALILHLAELDQQATRAQAEYDALLARNAEFKRECSIRLTAGAALVAEERLRQVALERGCAEHGNHAETDSGELAQAGASYVTQAIQQIRNHLLPAGVLWGRALWPWEWECWHPDDDPLTNLVRGASFIVHEIDRLLEQRRDSNG